MHRMFIDVINITGHRRDGKDYAIAEDGEKLEFLNKGNARGGENTSVGAPW
jgi:hypothetical protein